MFGIRILNYYLSNYDTFLSIQAGRVGPSSIFYTPKANNVINYTIAFYSYH